jgi:hypothetical protein
MPPRRRVRKIPDPPKEREMSRRRDKQLPDSARESKMRELRARIDSMDTTQRHTVDARNKEVAVEDATEERLFRAVARIGARVKMDIRVYEGNMDVKELQD